MTIGRDAEGRLVMVKRAPPGPGADRLRHEAAALEAAAGAGCVELRELVEEADGGARLVTGWVGGASLATALPPGPARVRTVAVALARSLAELHRRGLAHGAVVPEHVLLDGDRPVLCGLGGARLPGGAGDPSADDDVAALLALLAGLVAGDGGALPGQLRGVVAAGTAGGATAVAERLAALEPDPGPPRRELRPRPRAPERRPPPVRGLVVSGAAAVALLAVAIATWPAGEGPRRPTEPSTTTTGRCAPAPAPAADLDGDGCAEPVAITRGVVTAGDRRWRVGDPGDLVAVADWDCDDRATAVVVRPATGEVWIYDGWAAPGHPLTARPGPEAPGATAARAISGGAGCARLEVTTAAGGRRLLDVDRT